MRSFLAAIAAALTLSSASLGLATCVGSVEIDPEIPTEEREAGETEVLLTVSRRLTLPSTGSQQHVADTKRRGMSDLGLSQGRARPVCGHRVTPSVMAPLLT